MRVNLTDSWQDHLVQKLGEAEIHSFHGAFPCHDEGPGHGVHKGDYKGASIFDMAFPLRIEDERQDVFLHLSLLHQSSIGDCHICIGGEPCERTARRGCDIRLDTVRDLMRTQLDLDISRRYTRQSSFCRYWPLVGYQDYSITKDNGAHDGRYGVSNCLLRLREIHDPYAFVYFVYIHIYTFLIICVVLPPHLFKST